MDVLKEWLKKTIETSNHEIFKGGICKDIDIEPFRHGQVSVISEMNKVQITLKTEKGEQIIKAVLKLETSNELGKQMADDWQVFDGEIMMYNNILITMKGYLLQAGETHLPWPDCYLCADNKILLQNLCEEGYRAVSMEELLDVEHMNHVMRAIGKFHGISWIMDERQLLNEVKSKHSFLEEKKPFMTNLIRTTYLNLAKSIRENWEPEWTSAADLLSRLAEAPGDALQQEIINAKGNWNVLNHGDFSLRNMMFHYPDGSNVPDGVKFVDFQVCHYNSLAYDLINILYSSLQPFERDENEDTFLNVYLDSLTSICNKHNYRGQIPTINDIKSCMKRLPYFSTLNSVVYNIAFFMGSKQKDRQDEVDKFMESYGNEDKDGDGSDVLQGNDVLSNSVACAALKYELIRLLKQEIF